MGRCQNREKYLFELHSVEGKRKTRKTTWKTPVLSLKHMRVGGAKICSPASHQGRKTSGSFINLFIIITLKRCPMSYELALIIKINEHIRDKVFINK